MNAQAQARSAALVLGWAFLFPIVLPVSIAGGILFFWGTAALFLVAAAIWRAAHIANSWMGMRAWLVPALLVMPSLVVLLWDEARAPERTLRWGALLVLAWLAFALARVQGDRLWRDPAWRLAWVAPLLVHALLLFASAWWHDPVWQAVAGGRGGALKQPNWQALLFVVGLSVLAPSLARGRAWGPMLIAAVLIGGVWWTGSRSGFLTLLFVIALALFFARKARLRAAILWFLALALGVALAFVVEHLGHGVGAAPTRAMTPGSFGGRLMIWLLSWEVFLSHPLWGVGWGGLAAHGADALEKVLAAHPWFASVANRVVGAHAYAHNWVLQAMAEAGMFGLAGAMWLIGALLRKAWALARDPDDASTAPFLIVAAIAAHGLVSVSAAQPFFWFVFALAAAGVWPSSGVSARKEHALARAAWFVPALAAVMVAAHEARAAAQMEQAFSAPLRSEKFIQGMARAIEDPWLHASALHALFVKLVHDHASARQWAAAEPFAWALWRTAQEPNYCMIFIIIAHAKDDVLAERRWAARYLRLRPGFAPALAAYHHAWHEHGKAPLQVVRTW